MPGKREQQFEALPVPWKREFRSRALAAVERIKAKKKGHNDVFLFVREQMAGLKLSTEMSYGDALGVMKWLVHKGLNNDIPSARQTVRTGANGDVHFVNENRTEAFKVISLLAQCEKDSQDAREEAIARGADPKVLKDIGY